MTFRPSLSCPLFSAEGAHAPTAVLERAFSAAARLVASNRSSTDGAWVEMILDHVAECKTQTSYLVVYRVFPNALRV